MSAQHPMSAMLREVANDERERHMIEQRFLEAADALDAMQAENENIYHEREHLGEMTLELKRQVTDLLDRNADLFEALKTVAAFLKLEDNLALTLNERADAKANCLVEAESVLTAVHAAQKIEGGS